MKVIHTLISTCFLIVLTACSTKEREKNINNCDSFNKKYTLKKEKTITFKLDSVTAPLIDYVKYVKIKDSTYFTFLNQYNNTVYCYEYNSKKLNRKIKLTDPKKITGFEIISWNKILTYEYWSKRLTLQDSLGTIIKKITIPLKKENNGFYAMPTSHSPITYNNGSIYLVGGRKDREKAKLSYNCVAKIDSSFSNIKYLYRFPEIYSKLFFGGYNYRMAVTYTYNPVKNAFIFNFPASHKLFSTKDFKNDEKYCAGSEYIKSINNFDDFKNKNNFQFVVENGFYFCVLYDEYNKVYYRVSLLPSKYVEGEEYTRDMSVIILDEKLNIVGEKVFKNKIDFSLKDINSLHVSSDGFMIQNRKSFSDEDILSFDVYKLLKS
ncbi:DUF4221 family protein [Flavivirga eckloniae]|uniref:DUF4221 domain-containing protein n=1 Tax=Flavivirga eckloniae TaxID=1803846 RepID=A0A2K9PPL4_9FLAO|nr:DUF4221 family protein [Flavivirga eckloniae]AUP78497.1 hypothetical protein C1H87_07145 [Flavivirga eckloniae]